MQITVLAQSTSNLITNSSSEIFQIITDTPCEQIKQTIEKVVKANEFKGEWEEWHDMPDEKKKLYDSCTGMGGYLEVWDFETRYQEALSCVPDNKKHLYTREVHACGDPTPLETLQKYTTIDIDEGYTHTIDWIIKNLYVVDCDTHNCKKNEEGRIIALLRRDGTEIVPEYPESV